ncbi:hemolysin XhlA family protein [Histidinibacterium aquaticum]|uniref:Pseudouridine synthase n=1 Tax=Histidinibacterium aquaticum TaxID=2613962 RepID=A0A5J5GLK2_9RHOB|nr:hemolysin XhlA family protein [Histidinibacterium aquaticum]KAA9009010.1 pseudouridine synthase [Histidinibacterium aquaticum]
MDERHPALEARVAALETRSAVEDVHRENVERRLGHIEDTLKWLVRLVIGSILLAALAWMLGGGLVLVG